MSVVEDWEHVRSGIWRLRCVRLRFTVCRASDRREWVWVVERTNGLGQTSEMARGCTYFLRQAKLVAPQLLQVLSQLDSCSPPARSSSVEGT